LPTWRILFALLPPITTLFDKIAIHDTFNDDIHVVLADNFLEPPIG
jgi:hypothetical protein